MSAEVEEEVEAVEAGVVEAVVDDAVPVVVPVEDDELDVRAGEVAACLVVVLSE